MAGEHHAPTLGHARGRRRVLGRGFLGEAPGRDGNFWSVRQNRRVRTGRLFTCLAAVSVVAGVAAACVEQKGQLGSDCLKNQDCQSGVCSQLRCADQPPLFEFEAGPDAAADAADGAVSPETDGPAPTTDAPGTQDAPATGDATNVGPDSGSPLDASVDAVDEPPGPDASQQQDAADTSTDARVDAGDAD